MIHYHGTPITPQSELDKLAGKHFCVSFATRGADAWCLKNGQSVMWDNGAFTFHRLGGERSESHSARFCEWVEPRLGQPNWAVIPDVIDGTVEEQRELLKAWPFKFLGAPVWHMGLPVDYLLELADNWPRLCFGSTKQYWQVGSESWALRCDEAFNALAKHGHLPHLWVHMLRGLSLAGDRWPFASADSCNVGRNFKDDGGCDPERMARRIDAVQCPIKWTPRIKSSHQLELIA